MKSWRKHLFDVIVQLISVRQNKISIFHDDIKFVLYFLSGQYIGHIWSCMFMFVTVQDQHYKIENNWNPHNISNTGTLPLVNCLYLLYTGLNPYIKLAAKVEAGIARGFKRRGWSLGVSGNLFLIRNGEEIMWVFTWRVFRHEGCTMLLDIYYGMKEYDDFMHSDIQSG